MYSDDDDRVARTLFLSKLELLLPIPVPSVLGRTLPICRRQLPAGICHSASEEGRADLADM